MSEKCKHENTVYGELPELTHYEFCKDCKQSRAVYEQLESDWSDNELTALIEHNKTRITVLEAEVANQEEKNIELELELTLKDMLKRFGCKTDNTAVKIVQTYSMEASRLRNHVIKLEAWVDDLQKGMYINCVYCGHRYGPKENTPDTIADVLKKHIENCPNHPMSELKATNNNLLGRIVKLDLVLNKCTELFDKHWPPAMGCNGIMQVAGHLENVFKELTEIGLEAAKDEQGELFTKSDDYLKDWWLIRFLAEECRGVCKNDPAFDCQEESKCITEYCGPCLANYWIEKYDTDLPVKATDYVADASKTELGLEAAEDEQVKGLSL